MLPLVIFGTSSTRLSVSPICCPTIFLFFLFDLTVLSSYFYTINIVHVSVHIYQYFPFYGWNMFFVVNISIFWPFSWIFARKWPGFLQGPQLGIICSFLSLFAWITVISPVVVLVTWGGWLMLILGRDIVGLAVIMAGSALLLAFYSIMLWWRTQWQSSSMYYSSYTCWEEEKWMYLIVLAKHIHSYTLIHLHNISTTIICLSGFVDWLIFSVFWLLSYFLVFEVFG